ncbi:potassium channel family protein [Tenuibacillus multivorans]|uniref:Voltage-gated potassium channel n=1 Tax=Tenuibacillus multivorans TaxID=237069 RepID=A0A1H0CNE0_9BACI|nr:potassium channel protein [Tenuibacillus multivorans]GEL76228.1 potassium channel protein [Tenuibacillus multivorans]SDN59426.1 voltage-gated potassium channel [Tenuibacillus multivorans]
MFFRLIRRKIYKVDNKLVYTILLLFFILFSSYIIQVIEPETFASYSTALWWVMTTVTTVGYGDISPVTVAGQLFAMTAVYIIGIGLMGVFIGYIVDTIQEYRKNKEEGKLKYKDFNHYIIINYTKRSKDTIEELLNIHEDKDIVLIDESLDRTPIKHDRIHFISGNPANPRTLYQANINECHSVLIFASDHVENYSLSDGQTLLIATTIEGLGHQEGFDVYTIAEILFEQHISAFKHSKVDEFITPNKTSAHLIAKSATYNGTSEMFRQLTSSNYGDDIFAIKKHPTWSTYRDAYIYLLDRGATLLSAENQLDIAKRADESIPDDTELLIICNQENYDKIVQELAV